ncbi:MAG: hypothetical protein LUD52_01850 [Opitutae bacterium]|nr:hypothetical protein [Opitutae bacterium]
MQSNLSSPFNLRGRLSSPKLRLNTSALASVLLVAAFMYAMTSKYIFAPGLTVGLDEPATLAAENSKSALSQLEENPETTDPAATKQTLSLPLYDGELSGQKTTSVLTVKNESMFILDGKIYRRLLDALPPAAPDAPKRGILLAKMDRSVSVQTFFDLAKAAQDAGFSAVQIAGESKAKN